MSMQENVFQTTFEAKLEKIKTILDQNPHPNIARIKKIHVRDNGDAYGEYDQYSWNLKEYLKQIGPKWLNQQQIYNIFNQIVQGYQHLRKFKIVHRDLCLETIFVQQYKDDVIVLKIGNFELASVGKTRMSSTAGRLLFQAPEIYQIQNEYNEKCDIYSLGILFYYICYQQDFHINQLTRQSLDQFHINLRNQQFYCPPKDGVSQECKELLQQMIVCDDNQRISWDELYMNNILESNYMIINQIYYIQLAFRGQVEFKILNLQNNEYCCQEQIFSYGAILNQFIQFGQIKYQGTIINNLNQIQEILRDPNFQLLDFKQQIIIDDALQNIIHQIQQYFPRDMITKDKLLTEINNLMQPKSNSNINSTGQKIKIISKQTVNPEFQNQFYQIETLNQPVNVQSQQQNLSNILQVQNTKNDEIDVFGLQIGEQQQQQELQQNKQLFTSNQQTNNNQQFQQNFNFQDSQVKKQSVQFEAPKPDQNFKTNLPTTKFNQSGQRSSVFVGQINQQDQNNKNFQCGSQNFQPIPKPTNPSFQNSQIAKQSPFSNSQIAKPPDNQAPSFQNPQIATLPNNQAQPFQNSQITKPSDNQVQFNAFLSQKQPSAMENSPAFQPQFPNQKQTFQPPLTQTAKATSNVFPSNPNQPAQQQFQNKTTIPTNQIPQFPNSGKQINSIEQNKFQSPAQLSFTAPQQTFLNKGANPAASFVQNQFSIQPNADVAPQKNGVFDSQRMRQTQSSNTQLTREYEAWQSLTEKTQNQLEQSKNFNEYKNIYISLYHLNKHLIQKINNFNLNRENEDRVLKNNFLKDNTFSQSVPNLEKANDQIVKQIEISQKYLQNTEKDETLKSYLRQLYSFQVDMKKKFLF